MITFFTADALVAHAIGDYVLQSQWMATEKVRRSVACLAHVVTYTLPFLFLTRDWRALVFIAGTHFVVDRWRLARYVVWAKNWMGAPTVRRVRIYESGDIEFTRMVNRPVEPWSECKATGYPPDVPVWLAGWLFIIADNLIHICLNALALRLWG